MPIVENVVILGSGPAGLTAAIYTARAALQPLVLEGHIPGGQLIVSQEVENYPGFPDPISGLELMDRFRKQAERFGARSRSEAVQEVKKGERVFHIVAGNGTIETKTLIIATGAEARRLSIPRRRSSMARGYRGVRPVMGRFSVRKKPWS